MFQYLKTLINRPKVRLWRADQDYFETKAANGDWEDVWQDLIIMELDAHLHHGSRCAEPSQEQTWTLIDGVD